VVGFNIKGRDVQSIVEELQRKADQKMKLPTGYYMTYGGSFENLNNAKQRLMIAVPIALALIFVMLFLAFNSVKESLLIYTAIPLSIIGGVFLMALRGMPFSISAGVGFIALFGVAVLNGIVLISEFNRLHKRGIKNIVRIVIDGGESRLRPVLMTAFVASLGFIPMAVSSGAGAEVQRPLATVVIGGLMVATFLTLFVLPLLYVNIEKGFKMKKHNHKNFAAVLILIFSVMGTGVKSQTPISLQNAINTALENNRNLKNEKLKSEYSKALIKSANDIPQTGISMDYGQINSAYNDMKFGISQNIAFPTVYKKQKNVYTEEWKRSLLNVSLKEYELKKGVSLTFYNILYWKDKEQLLHETLKLYTDFLNKASIRLKAGESNILEKTTASNQKSAIEIQLKQVEQELSVLGYQLQWLLNTETDFLPEDQKLFSGVSKAELSLHPAIKLLQQQKNVSEQQIALEKAKMLPGLQLAYNLNSFRGMGADDKVYGSAPQFHSVQLGVSVPIFSGGQKSRIQAAKIAESVAENDVLNTEFALKNQFKKTTNIYQNNLDIVSQYESSELKNADIITETAKKQFLAGEINYLEFVILVNQAVTLKNNYADAVWKLNQSAIELEYLTLNP
jgi:cobalt-zinc-cadmium resistance protein CzcA